MGLGLESIDFDWGNIQLLDQLRASDKMVGQCNVYVVMKRGPTITSIWTYEEESDKNGKFWFRKWGQVANFIG